MKKHAISTNTDSTSSIPSISTADIVSMRPLLIRASAGTGKTYQLTGRLLRILLGGAAPDSVIATTFTRKAAGEILTRVLTLLAKAATDQSQVALGQLAAQTGLTEITTAQCIELTHSLLRDIHRLRILTLDSLFSQLARSFAYEIGIPPGWRLADEIEEMSVRESAVDAMLSAVESADLLSILAQLSKGDTKRSVRNDVLQVIHEGYQVSRGCRESAWDSLQVPREPSDAAYRQCISTLMDASVGHKSADTYLRRLGEWIDLRLWDRVDQMDLVASMPQRGSGDDVIYYKKVMPREISEALRTAADGLRTHILGLLRAQTLATGRVVEAYETQVSALKQFTRAFSFDDISYRLSHSLSPVSMNQIGMRMDGSIDHLLLDEFQDTSPVQWSVLKPLAETTARLDGSGSFFCVGDTKQAIYGWRGGVAEIFDQVCEQIPGVQERGQNTSFRSSTVVMDAINLIFKNIHRHPAIAVPATGEGPETCKPETSQAAMKRAIDAFEASFPIHDAARKDLRGYMTIRTSNAKEQESAPRKLSHLKYVASRIIETSKASPKHSIGVLTRTNLSVAWLIQLLRGAGVDVSQEGGNPLTDSPAVDLVVSCLMMPEHPGDARWSFHVANSPLADPLGLKRFEHASAASDRIRRMLEDDGIARSVEWMGDKLAPFCDHADALRLRQLVYLAQQYEGNRGPRVSDFVNVIRHKRIEKPRSAQVRVMTIHQAKGLEFDVVVLPEMDDDLVRSLSGTIGLRDSIDKPPKGLLRYIRQSAWPMLPEDWKECFEKAVEAKYTEALCLLYVALTRPRHWLDVIVQPSKHGSPTAKSNAALLYHATSSQCDATLPCQTWFECGDPMWYL